MQDAAEIVDAVNQAVSGGASSVEAVTSYEVKRRPRGARDVALSLETVVKMLASDHKDSPMFQVGLQKMEGQTPVLMGNAVQLAD